MYKTTPLLFSPTHLIKIRFPRYSIIFHFTHSLLALLSVTTQSQLGHTGLLFCCARFVSKNFFFVDVTLMPFNSSMKRCLWSNKNSHESHHVADISNQAILISKGTKVLKCQAPGYTSASQYEAKEYKISRTQMKLSSFNIILLPLLK